MSCGMKHPKAKKATKKAKPKKKKQIQGWPSGSKGNIYFLLDIEMDFCYPFHLCYIVTNDFHEKQRKEVRVNEEVGEYLFGIGDVSSIFFRVCGDSERRKD